MLTLFVLWSGLAKIIDFQKTGGSEIIAFLLFGVLIAYSSVGVANAVGFWWMSFFLFLNYIPATTKCIIAAEQKWILFLEISDHLSLSQLKVSIFHAVFHSWTLDLKILGFIDFGVY